MNAIPNAILGYVKISTNRFNMNFFPQNLNILWNERSVKDQKISFSLSNIEYYLHFLDIKFNLKEL